MPEKYRVNYTRLAAEHIQDIVTYIECDSLENAAKTAGRLVKSIESLEIFPYRFAVVRQSAELGEDVRSMAVRPFLVRYRVDPKNRVVTILSVRHGARRPGM